MSGFMMWESAYSELYFTETLMPDLTTEIFDSAIEEYQSRARRFGK
jgi:undecaprenyl diphosphate synthase